MYLFTRRMLLNPAQIRTGLKQAHEFLGYLNEKTELGISLYQVLQGATLGTLTYAFRTESYSAAVESTDALVRSEEYLKRVEKVAPSFIGNPEDSLAEVIHTEGDVTAPPAAASVVNATMEVSRAGDAVAWAVDLGRYLTQLTAVPGAVLTSNFGQYGQISWIGYGSSLAQIEESGKKINADPGYLQRLRDSAGLFVPGSGRAVLSRRLA